MPRRRKIPANTNFFNYVNMNPDDQVTTDCVCRALSAALEEPWEDMYMSLARFSVKTCLDFHDTACYEQFLKPYGYTKMPQLRHEDRTKYTGREFCMALNQGIINPGLDSIIAHIGGHHVVAIKRTPWDRDLWKVWDTWNSTGGTIGNYWIKIK